MSTLFVSHSSRDDAIASRLAARLEADGHRVFLDFDPVDGIPAGSNWEQELYRRVRQCRGIVVLCSQHSMASKWCFMEITHARALGKPLFPIKIDDCELDGVLSEHQVVDLTRDEEQGYQRLRDGILKAGLDPSDVFDWDGKRSPYPGLLALQERDAVFFFGRDDEIGEGLDLLSRVRRLGEVGLVMLLGASGSGKSSLVRAGLLPRLRRDTDRWIVVDPFRPRDDPARELAHVLGAAFAGIGSGLGADDIHQRLRAWMTVHRATPGEATEDGNPLVELVSELRRESRRDDARVLVVVDQFEELLARPESNAHGRFLALLRDAAETPGTPILVVATMRSDFLGQLQNHAALLDARYESLSLGPMSPDDIAQIIHKPAEVAGIELEPGLAEILARDAETEDALPLLAFTLRQLNERHGQDRRLTIDAYRRQLGGLQGAVANAAADLTRGLDETQMSALRRAFLMMVRVTEDGAYARRPAHRNAIGEDPAMQQLLERFVTARLLVADEADGAGTVEVAHEALFRSWGTLRGWLDENAEALHLERELHAAAESWDQSEVKDGYLWRGGRLARARELHAQQRLRFSDVEAAFVEASTTNERSEARREEARQRKELEQARQLAEAQARSAQRLRIGLIAASVLFAIAAGLGALATVAQRTAVANADKADRNAEVAKQERIAADAAREAAVGSALEAKRAEARMRLQFEESLIGMKAELELRMDQLDDPQQRQLVAERLLDTEQSLRDSIDARTGFRGDLDWIARWEFPHNRPQQALFLMGATVLPPETNLGTADRELVDGYRYLLTRKQFDAVLRAFGKTGDEARQLWESDADLRGIRLFPSDMARKFSYLALPRWSAVKRKMPRVADAATPAEVQTAVLSFAHNVGPTRAERELRAEIENAEWCALAERIEKNKVGSRLPAALRPAIEKRRRAEALLIRDGLDCAPG